MHATYYLPEQPIADGNFPHLEVIGHPYILQLNSEYTLAWLY